MIQTHAVPGELVRVAFVCAVHDRPYLKEAMRGPDGLFRAARTLVPKRPALTATALTIAPNSPRLPSEPDSAANEWDWGNPPRARCPHCEAQSFIRCGRCRLFICDGRMEKTAAGYLFRCRESCGGQGICTGTITGFAIASRGTPGHLRLAGSRALPGRDDFPRLSGSGG